ncbi:hypothetical protein [Agrobacterium sp. ST15.13.015]|uniref:hypothetical protein n=1 Tax=Agrobacterium sp. ST15.13.015 TaxID=3017319 RepID=UPI0022CC6229|nr:hypothetical protein [Agrobacterium sp. ST15.13.015]MCZ7500708.1 hypothetical protein [Rhizobium rhizogenes]
MVETIGEAFNADWQLFARCVDGRVDLGHAALKCEWRYDLDMMTLVATRGRDFPLASIAGRLRCPRCGNRRISVTFVLPGNRKAERPQRPISRW